MDMIHCRVGDALTKGLFNDSVRGDRGTGRIVFGTPPISPALSLRDAARTRPSEALTIAGSNTLFSGWLFPLFHPKGRGTAMPHRESFVVQPEEATGPPLERIELRQNEGRPQAMGLHT
jgi:hypothetical protein